MGDYHRQQDVDGLPCPAWYSGTHEPDNFPSHHQTGVRTGGCLRVEVSAGRPAAVRSLLLQDGLRWTRIEAMLRGDADIDRLEAELRGLTSGRAQHTLCCVDLVHAELGFAGSQRLRAVQDQLAPEFELLSFEGEVREAPTADELASLSERPGLSGLAAKRLQELASDPARSGPALAALARLHRAVRA
jgi:hypothetical protein